MNLPIPLDQKKIASFCQKHHIDSLSLFGSVLTTQFQESSDIDILVQFEKKHTPGFFKFAEIEAELSEIMGRSVDLNTPNSLSRYFKDDVVAKAKLVYG